MKTQNVLFFGTIIAAGCAPMYPSPDSGSLARDSGVQIDSASPADARSINSQPAMVDASSFEVGFDASAPDKPVIKPVPGTYAVRPDPSTTNDGGDPITPLDAIGLTVRVDATTGLVTIFYFAAVDTNGIIPVTDGSFDFTHGRGGTDGTVCPANGYSISGSFVSPTEFRGAYADISFCQFSNGGNYIATLVPDHDGGE